MKKKRQQRDEHLRCVDERKTHRTGEMHLRCLGCGDELTLVLPCSLSMLPVPPTRRPQGVPGALRNTEHLPLNTRGASRSVQ
jgi:hypothetical protein